ncbi:U3 small nucleolar RNA-associated protein 21 like protein [Astathelohania contejeani]|uniref:U3 small nucleolar RNA-associated protein 21 like protein n=1 Tax=Astathelohania contejeani TaxID=164912 RepID=A0ABQ7HYG9_9MICR|nr:U3 small nucleolar RNA-associated protein 21 like protein [Thelohania contejeani]
MEKSLFSHIRTLNQVASNKPFLIASRNNKHYITTLTNVSYKVYDCTRLNTIFEGPLLEGEPSCLYQRGDNIYISTDSTLFICNRSVIIQSYEIGGINQILGLGEVIIILLSGEIRVYEQDMTNYTTMNIKEEVNVIFHPATYCNKILIGTSNGDLIIYNVVKNKEIFRFEKLGSAITAISGAPVLDVVGVGFACGDVVILNLRSGKRLLEFDCEEAVRSLCFQGNILWATTYKEKCYLIDLSTGQKLLMRYTVGYAQTLGEDLICVGDNKLQIFKVEDFKMEIVKERRGLPRNAIHTGIKFYNRKNLLVAVEDEIYNLGVYSDEQSFRYKMKPKGLGKYNQLKCEDGIITVLSHGRLHKLEWENKREEAWIEKKAVCYDISGGMCVLGCGFKIVVVALGSGKGRLEERGVIRQRISTTLKIVMISFDIMEDRVCYSDGYKINTIKGVINPNGILKEESVNIGEEEEINDLILKNNLLIIRYKYKVVVVDMTLLKIARQFILEQEIIDLDISYDLRWILICTLNQVITYDIMTGMMVGSINTIKNIQKISFSMNLDYLVILMDGLIEVYYNNSLFNPIVNSTFNFSKIEKEDECFKEWKTFEMMCLRGLAYLEYEKNHKN